MILFFFSSSFISISFQSSREALITRLSFMCIDVLSGSVLTDAVPKGKIYEIAMPVTSITAGLFCLSLFLISIAYFLHCQCTIWKRVFSFFYRRSIRLYFNRRCSIKTYKIMVPVVLPLIVPYTLDYSTPKIFKFSSFGNEPFPFHLFLYHHLLSIVIDGIPKRKVREIVVLPMLVAWIEQST